MTAPRSAPTRVASPASRHFGMPTPAARGELPETWLADLSCLPRLLLRGPGGAEWLHARGLAAPAVPGTVTERAGGGFTACAGDDEWLVVGGRDETVFQHPGGDEPPVFTRSDFDLVLGGRAAAAILAEFCEIPAPTDPLRFTFTRMAGVNVWLRAMRGPDGPAWRVGGDPGYGEYLSATLRARVEAAHGGTAGLDDLFPNPGEVP